MLTVLEVLFI